MLLTTTTAEKLFVQFSAQFQAAFDAVPTYVDGYCTTMPSATKENLYHWIAQLPGMKEWVGEFMLENVSLRDYTVRNKIYKEAIKLDKWDVKNDQHGAFSPIVDAFGQAVRRWPDEVMAAVAEAGKSTNCYDGQWFFDTDHPICLDDPGLGTFSNNLVGSTYNLATDPLGVWQAGSEAMAAFKGEAGKTLAVQADTIMVPPSLRRWAVQAAKAEIVPQTFTSNSNANASAAGVSNVYMGDFKVIVNPYLTEAACYIMCCNRAVKPFVWQLREAPQFVNLVDPTLPNMFNERAFVYGAEGAGAGAYSLPFLAVRCAVS
jgi:phage major head subunit gpT-like protein